ncbi:hypothetical protein [Coleofasciculus sp.]|uniref:hypothetical protein n=1 Tax=Coleofasciculus sp. TaxID=3100458 RepID=UPI003A17065F
MQRLQVPVERLHETSGNRGSRSVGAGLAARFGLSPITEQQNPPFIQRIRGSPRIQRSNPRRDSGMPEEWRHPISPFLGYT